MHLYRCGLRADERDDFKAARAFLERSLELLDGTELVRAMVLLAEIFDEELSFQESLDTATRAVALATEIGDRRLALRAELVRATAIGQLDPTYTLGRARAEVEAALEELETVGHEEDRDRALILLARFSFFEGRTVESAAIATRLMEQALHYTAAAPGDRGGDQHGRVLRLAAAGRGVRRDGARRRHRRGQPERRGPEPPDTGRSARDGGSLRGGPGRGRPLRADVRGARDADAARLGDPDDRGDRASRGTARGGGTPTSGDRTRPSTRSARPGSTPRSAGCSRSRSATSLGSTRPRSARRRVGRSRPRTTSRRRRSWRMAKARVLADRGEFEEALTLADEAVEIIDRTDYLVWQGDGVRGARDGPRGGGPPRRRARGVRGGARPLRTEGKRPRRGPHPCSARAPRERLNSLAARTGPISRTL